MFSLKFDKDHNLLTITFRGQVDESQGELLCQRIEKELHKTKKGFMILTDLSEVEIFEDTVYSSIKKLMILCNAHNVSKIFRVIPDKTKDIGFSTLSIFHYSKNVSIHTFKTLSEAYYYIKLNTNITFNDRVFTFLKIFRIKLLNLSESVFFRASFIVCGFIVLVISRQIFKAFGISLGYIYITLIALSGLWFETKGGITAASTSLAIFLIEVNMFSLWTAREIVLKTLVLRVFIYFSSGILIGSQSKQQRILKEKLQFLAVHDELTGIINYRHSINILKKEFERSKRHHNNLTISIIDIDDFKQINDTYGHLVGNDTIKTFSSLMAKELRNIDTIGRYGGDEFILIFPESTKEQGIRILERIRKNISSARITSSFLINKKSFSITFSAGIASLSIENKNINDLINNADKALYRAKQKGRNKIAF